MRREITGLVLAFLLSMPCRALQDEGGEPFIPEPPDPFLEQPPVKSPSRVDRPLARAPSTVTVITGGQIRLSGARFLSDILRMVPGIEVQRLSATESNVAARSYNDDSSASQGMLCLVDGRQVYNEFFGSVVWDSLPVSLDDIERVEVIRGPGSFLYGPNAMHGVINIVTRPAKKLRCGSCKSCRDGKICVHGEDGEDEEVSASVAGGAYRSNLSRVSYFRREEKDAFKAIVVRDDINAFDPRSANAKDKTFMELRYERQLDEEDHRVEMACGVNEQKYDVLIPKMIFVPTATFFNEVQEGFLRADYILGDFRGRASWTRFGAMSVPDLAYTGFELESDTADVDLQYSFGLEEDLGVDKHAVTVGTGYRFATFETHNEDVAMGRHKTGLAWAFVQDEWNLFGDFWVTSGVRWDHHSVTGNAVSPRLAAVWEFRPDHSVRASAGYGFRNPSMRELWLDMPLFGGMAAVVGNRDLDPEQIRSFEAGYRGFFPGIAIVEVNAYYNLVDRLVQYGDPLLGEGPMNADKEKAYGVEVALKQRICAELSAFANFSFGIREDRDTGGRIPFAPKYKANVGTRFDLVDPALSSMAWVTFFDEVRFSDPRNGVWIGEAEDYTLLNGRIEWKIPDVDVRVFVQGMNITDYDHREHPEGRRYGFVGLTGLEVSW